MLKFFFSRLCLFGIYSVSKNSEFWIALSNLLNLYKGAISNLGVMCKAIAYSIGNRLLYLQNLKVRQQPEQELLANFKDYSKEETAFLVFVRLRHFEKLFRLAKQTYKSMCLHRTSSLGFFCSVFIIMLRRTFVLTSLMCRYIFRRNTKKVNVM